MRFLVLGPLQILRDGRPLAIGTAHKLRLVLAALLVRADQQVSEDWLCGAVWGERAPASARRNLQLYVYRLRRVLGAERIGKESRGYTLHTGGDLDAARFQELAAAGRASLEAGDAEAAERALRDALGLWRGPAFAEFPDSAPLAREADRLERLRLAAYEDWAEAGLSLGRAAELAAELAEQVLEHPYRENLRALHMLALYRSGRQAEALESFRLARETLAEQLGIEPGPHLQRLHQAILRADKDLLVTVQADPDARPYKGLAVLEPDDAPWFFGRDRLVARLRDRASRPGVVGVFGASGSGKSSLLRAGLLSAATGRTRLLTPSGRPMEALGRTGGLDLIVVDQFEEVFTLCEDPGEREMFVKTLLEASREHAAVVLGVRADFLGHISRYPELVEALEAEAQILVGPPSPLELREIVTGPADRAGLRIEPELVAAVLGEAGSEPGALPLVSHALLETWRRRDGQELTLAAYREAGGVRGAIARTAEEVFGAFTGQERRAARLILLRLTAQGHGVEAVRRPIARAELDGLAPAPTIDGVVDRLARARLLVLGAERIELAHEVLITAWPRLHGWLADDRADLAVHRRLTQAAQNWEALGRDPGALLRGTPLMTALSWEREHPGELNEIEGAFVRAGGRLEESEHEAVRRRNGTLRRLNAALGVLLVLALLGGGLAVRQRQATRHEQITAQAHQLALQARALQASDPSAAGLQAVRAYRLRPDAETRGALLSAAAADRGRFTLGSPGQAVYAVAVSPDGSLIASAGADGAVSLWDVRTRALAAVLPEHRAYAGPGGAIYARTVQFSRDGSLLASTARGPAVGPSPGSLVVWEVASRRPVVQRPLPAITSALALSPDGARVAVGTGGGTIEIHEVRGRGRTSIPLGGGPALHLAFSSDGKWLVSTGDRDRPVIWDAATGRRHATVETDGVDNVTADPAGEVLATTTLEGELRTWTLRGGRALPRGTVPAQGPWTWTVSAPVGGRVATLDENGLVTLWDLESLRPLERFQDRGRVEGMSAALSPDGATLVTAGFGGQIIVRRLAASFAGATGPVTDLDVSPDGRTVAASTGDGAVRLWDGGGGAPRVLGRLADRVEAVEFQRGGPLLAALSRDHRIGLWDTATGEKKGEQRYDGVGVSTDVAFQPGGSALVTAATVRRRWDVSPSGGLRPRPFTDIKIAGTLAFSPDGRLLYSGGQSGNVLVWDMASDARVDGWASGHGAILDIAVSPDGRLLATTGTDMTVRLWDAATARLLATLTGHTAPGQVLAFGPGGRILASGGQDHAVILWDVAARTRIATLTGHTARVQALAFTPDGHLLSGAEENRIVRWPLSAAAALARICAETPSPACGQRTSGPRG